MEEQIIFKETESENLEIMSFKDSIFYMVFVMMVFPAVKGFIGDFFNMKFLTVRELAVMGITGSFDTISLFISALFPLGAEAVISKSIGRRDYDSIRADFTSAFRGCRYCGQRRTDCFKYCFVYYLR